MDRPARCREGARKREVGRKKQECEIWRGEEKDWDKQLFDITALPSTS